MKRLTSILVVVCVAGFFTSMICGAQVVTAGFMFAMPLAFIAWGGVRKI